MTDRDKIILFYPAAEFGRHTFDAFCISGFVLSPQGFIPSYPVTETQLPVLPGNKDQGSCGVELPDVQRPVNRAVTSGRNTMQTYQEKLQKMKVKAKETKDESKESTVCS